MKENSIEEDIKNINKGLYELEDSYELHQARWAKRIFENIKEKLEHILSDYKRTLKENEELKRLHIQDNKHLDFIMEHSIPIQKIKDKIEKLKINLVNMQGEELLIYESKIDVLQELLEVEGRK